MARVTYLTRKTTTSIEATAKRAAELIVDELPDVIERVFETESASGLDIKIDVKPGGRTEGAKDPEVVIKSKPRHGDQVVKIKAKMVGEGDDAQLSLIGDFGEGDLAEAEPAPEDLDEGDEAATG